MASDLSALTDEEIADLYSGLLREIERRRVIADAQARQAEIARAYQDAVAASPPKDLAALPQGAVVGPGERIFIDGVEWINSSGAFLSPHAAGPAAYPQGWQRARASAPDPNAVAAWAPDATYQVGDHATYDGKVFKCIQGHKSQADWTPPAVPALWAPA